MPARAGGQPGLARRVFSRLLGKLGWESLGQSQTTAQVNAGISVGMRPTLGEIPSPGGLFRASLKLTEKTAAASRPGAVGTSAAQSQQGLSAADGRSFSTDSSGSSGKAVASGCRPPVPTGLSALLQVPSGRDPEALSLANQHRGERCKRSTGIQMAASRSHPTRSTTRTIPLADPIAPGSAMF